MSEQPRDYDAGFATEDVIKMMIGAEQRTISALEDIRVLDFWRWCRANPHAPFQEFHERFTNTRSKY